MYIDIFTDIVLLENQLAYFVLDGLYKLAFGKLAGKYPSFELLCFKFFSDTIKSTCGEIASVLHFTDLGRCALLKNYPSKKHSKDFIANIPNAVKLYESESSLCV